MCSPDELRALSWLPGASRPDEWVTPADLAGFLAETFGHRFTVAYIATRLGGLKRKGLVVRRRGAGEGVDVWRRTPKGSQVLDREGSTVA